METLKLVLVGPASSSDFPRDVEHREALVGRIVGAVGDGGNRGNNWQCVASGDEAACFAAFSWLLTNHHLDLLLSVRSPLVEAFLKTQDVQVAPAGMRHR